MKTFKELKVWQKSHELVLEVYKITKCYPSEEKFGLISQLRRSSSSIPMNLAEGFKRRSRKDFAHFVNLAESSLEETKYTLFLSYELTYLDKNKFEELNKICDEIGRMLGGWIRSVER